MTRLEEKQGSVITLCMYCGKIKDEFGNWLDAVLEDDVHENHRVSHGICDGCMEEIVKPELDAFKEKYAAELRELESEEREPQSWAEIIRSRSRF